MPEISKTANQIKVGAGLTYVTIIIQIIVGLVYTPFMLQTLGQSEYGLYSLAHSVIAYLTVLDLGFGNAIIRYTAKYRAEGNIPKQNEMFGMFIVLYSIIGLIALCAGSIMAMNAHNVFDRNMSVDEVQKTEIMLWILTLNLAFTFPMSIWGSIITAYERFVFLRVISIIRSILNPIIMVAFLLFGYRAIAMVIITTVFNIVTLLINFYYCRINLAVKVVYGIYDWKLLREIAIYSMWVFLNQITEKIYWSGGQFILGAQKGTADVAKYSVAIQIKDLYYMFSTAISSVFLPRITTMVAKGVSDKEISDLFIKLGRIQYIIVGLILVGFVLLGKTFVILWAGADYELSYYIALLFLCSTSVPLIQNIAINILQARNQQAFRAITIVIISTISLLISIPISAKYGAIGCAVATTVAVFIAYSLILNIYYYKTIHLNIPLFWINILKMSLTPVFLVFLGKLILSRVLINNWFSFCLASVILMIFYCFLMFKLSLNKEEKDLFFKPILIFLRKINK